MSTDPSIIERAATPYAAITTKVTMAELGTVVPPLNMQVADWLRSQGIATAGVPFWKYNVVEMERGLEIEAGVATTETVDGEGTVRGGVLPAGRYATLRHGGHPDTLVDATALYYSDPSQDMNERETELSFRLAD